MMLLRRGKRASARKNGKRQCHFSHIRTRKKKRASKGLCHSLAAFISDRAADMLEGTGVTHIL